MGIVFESNPEPGRDRGVECAFAGEYLATVTLITGY
jgi:hypothetical protein